MAEPTIADRTRKLIADHLDIEPGKVVDTAALVDDLGADSLDKIELVMQAEEEFGIEISDQEADKCTGGDGATVAQFVAMVERIAASQVAA